MVDQVSDLGSVSPLNAISISTLIQQLKQLCSRLWPRRTDAHLSREAVCLLTYFLSDRGEGCAEELSDLIKSVFQKLAEFATSNPHALLEDLDNSLQYSSSGDYGLLTADEARVYTGIGLLRRRAEYWERPLQ